MVHAQTVNSSPVGAVIFRGENACAATVFLNAGYKIKQIEGAELGQFKTLRKHKAPSYK